MEFLLQPGVYGTGSTTSLLKMLDNMWLKRHMVGSGTLYVLSGFANYNGGVRFYPYFSQHVQQGGKIIAIFGGSKSQRLSSIQAAKALLQCGADVHVINRKRLVHAKCYGFESSSSEELVITSGNFTGPGMSQNVEAAIHIDNKHILEMNFSWKSLVESIFRQSWDIYQLELSDIVGNPGWSLLYDETYAMGKLDESQELTMIITLSHSDTARIQASPGSKAGLGTQYFWLSKGTFDFFPALTEKNKRGIKNTYSCNININYIDIGVKQPAKVTFESDNNLDFRLGTGALRYTKIAGENDLALLTRLSEYDYELRIVKSSAAHYSHLLKYATTYIGHFGKRFGYIGNDELKSIESLFSIGT
ncbi:MAG: restriction endonuclease [Defluviitaleaceae bacterium]|nr:restriction endonuclease [Defluviitaleaceae bacterium]